MHNSIEGLQILIIKKWPSQEARNPETIEGGSDLEKEEIKIKSGGDV